MCDYEPDRKNMFWLSANSQSLYLLSLAALWVLASSQIVFLLPSLMSHVVIGRFDIVFCPADFSY